MEGRSEHTAGVALVAEAVVAGLAVEIGVELVAATTELVALATAVLKVEVELEVSIGTAVPVLEGRTFEVG